MLVNKVTRGEYEIVKVIMDEEFPKPYWVVAVEKPSRSVDKIVEYHNFDKENEADMKFLDLCHKY